MEINEITKRQWLLTNVSSKTYKKDVFEFMKSLNCACHIESYGWKPTTPITFECIIEEDI